MRKTLLYTSDYSPARGGVARYLSGLAAFFRDRVEVVVADDAHRRWWSAAVWFVMHRGQYDQLLVSHVLPFGTAAMVAGWFTGKPYVVIVHGMDIGLAKKGIMKRFVAGAVLRRAVTVVANSRALEKEVRDEFGVKRSVVVYPSVSRTTPDPSCPSGGETRLSVPSLRFPSSSEEGLGVVRVRLLTVARLVERKGHLRVLEGIAILRRDHPELAITYTIVGDGPMRGAIESTIKDLGLPSVHIVTDAADESLPSFYADADIFVLPVVRDPIDREGFGMVYLEAAAHGVPSIATNMPGVDEAVADGETGILVQDGDIAGLASAVYRLAMDSALRTRLGSAARQRVQDEFNAERQFSKLIDLL